ncbi:MAG: MarC family protein [Bryobacterales bacterium]|nr:MarC family protein [Bryobacterales bacterium]
MDFAFAAKFLGALFAIMNPFVNLPVFLALTQGQTVGEQRDTAIKAIGYTAVMCLILSLAGGKIIGFFGVTIDAFRVAGGIVLLGIALAMLNGKPVASHERNDDEKEAHAASAGDDESDVAFYPMTFPMIVGPGTIATLIIYAAQARGEAEYAAFAAVLTLILAALFVVLFFAASIGKILSSKMRVIMTRLMGMILASIAVEMIFAGAKAMLPGLA